MSGGRRREGERDSMTSLSLCFYYSAVCCSVCIYLHRCFFLRSLSFVVAFLWLQNMTYGTASKWRWEGTWTCDRCGRIMHRYVIAEFNNEIGNMYSYDDTRKTMILILFMPRIPIPETRVRCPNDPSITVVVEHKGRGPIKYKRRKGRCIPSFLRK